MKNFLLSLIMMTVIFGCQKTNLDPTQGPLLQGPQVIKAKEWKSKFKSNTLETYAWFSLTGDWKQLKNCWNINKGETYSVLGTIADSKLSKDIAFIFGTSFLLQGDLETINMKLYTPNYIKTAGQFILPPWLVFNDAKMAVCFDKQISETTFNWLITADANDRKILINEIMETVDFKGAVPALTFKANIIYAFKTTNGKQGFFRTKQIKVEDVLSPETNLPTRKYTTTLDVCFNEWM